MCSKIKKNGEQEEGWGGDEKEMEGMDYWIMQKKFWQTDCLVFACQIIFSLGDESAAWNNNYKSKPIKRGCIYRYVNPNIL